MRVTLFGKESCHLCDEAEAMLRILGITPEYVDIEADVALLEGYGLRIPVLKRLDNGAELGWPFDAEAVLCFLGD